MLILLDKKKWIHFVLTFWLNVLLFAPTHASAPNAHLALDVSRASKHPQELIVLIHGLMRSSLSMWPLKMYLKSKGYLVYSYDYPSAKYSIQEHGVYLNQLIRKLIRENPEVRVSFVTHSLGGIITREALSRLNAQELNHMGCIIMLAPPSHGSHLAKLSLQIVPFIGTFIKPLAELSSEAAAYIHRVPVPKIKMGIIAGQFDAKVPPEFAQLGGSELRVVNATHTFIMNNGDAKRLILSFLEHGTFAAQ